MIFDRITRLSLAFSVLTLVLNAHAGFILDRSGVGAFAPITARVVYENDTTATADRRSGVSYNGKIVLASAMGRKFYAWMLEVAIPGGALAVVLESGDIDQSLGLLELTTATYKTDYSIPVIGISRERLGLVVSCLQNATLMNETLIATVDAEGEITPWRSVATSGAWWFFSIFTAAASCFLGAFAFIRLRDHFLVHQSLLVGVPQAVLYLELLGCLSRFIYWSVDPMYSRSVIPAVVHSPMRSWSLCFSIASLLLLVFYWHETIASTSMRFSWSIDQFRLVAYPLLAFIFLLELAVDIIYYSGGDVWAILFVGLIYPIIYLVISLALALYFAVTASRILLKLRKLHKNGKSTTFSSPSSQESADLETAESGTKPGSKKQKNGDSRSKSGKVGSVATKLLAVGFTHILACCIGLYTLSGPYRQLLPAHYMYLWVVLHFMVNCRAFAAIWMLRSRANRGKGNSKRSTTRTDSDSQTVPSSR